MSRCNTCRRELNDGTPESLDCGGDCMRCMAEAGDPNCRRVLLSKEEVERFERWAVTAGYPIRRDGTGDYMSFETIDAVSGWQAALDKGNQ